MNSELLDSSSDSVDAIVPSPRPRTALSVSITQRTLWTMVALVVAILGGIVLISQALGPIILLLLAIIFGEGIRPIVERLECYRIPPPLAIIAIYLVLAVVAGAFLWLLLSPLLTELGSLIQRLPDYQQELQKQLSSLHQQLKEQGATGQAVQNVASSLAATIQQSAPALIAVPFTFLSGIFGLVVDLVIVITMTLFWLLGSRSFKRFLVALLPLNAQAHASSVIAEMGLAFGGYVRGTVISMLIIGSVTGGGLALLGVPYAVLLGMLAGLCELLPYLGPWIAGTVSVVLAWIALGPTTALAVVVLFILIQELEGNVVEPLVMSRSVHIDPLVVIVAVLIGINLLGIIGAVLAVPIAAGIQVVLVRVLAPAIRSASAKTVKNKVAAAQPSEGAGLAHSSHRLAGIALRAIEEIAVYHQPVDDQMATGIMTIPK